MNANETPTASQPQPAESATPGTSDYSAFLGGSMPEPDLSVEESPAPSTEGAEAEAEPELSGDKAAVVEEEQPAGSEEAEPEAQAATTEEEAEQPPSVEERLKDLTQREAEAYQQRYPTAWKMLNDPKTAEDMKHLLLDKIDGDREIQRRMAEEQEAGQNEEEEPTLETEPEAVETQPAAAAAPDPVEARKAYYGQIDNLVKTSFDPQAIKEVGDTLLEMFNVNTKLLDDPNFPAEDKAQLKGLVDSVQAGAPRLARYMADTVSTMLPHVLPAALDLVMPGFGQMYERQMYGSAWERIRQQVDATGKTLYEGLPAYPAIKGTPEADKFADVMRDAAAQIPGFDSIVYRDTQGRVLPQEQQAEMKYALVARVISGQKVSPEVVAQAVATGKKLAGQADRRRQAGRALGAGQPTAKSFDKGGAGAGTGEDSMMDALDAEIARQNTNMTPIQGRTAAR